MVRPSILFFGEKKMSLVQMFKENVISTVVVVVFFTLTDRASTMLYYILFLFYVDPLLDWNPKSCGDDGSALNFIFRRKENVISTDV